MQETFETLFEIGASSNGKIGIRVTDWDHAEIAKDPLYLSAIILGLYDTILTKIPDHQQIEFQNQFLQVLTHLIQKKEDYDPYISQKHIDN